MAVSRDEIVHVASLARLSLTAAEAEALGRDLNQILEYVRQLEAVDVDGVLPLTHAQAQPMTLREDLARPSPGQAALANAPAVDDGLVAVPRILEST
ncbi:MAG: Asp-tRNA(Asn)/Glu-tRNA(Gln) amidotransferase subunit GatC [Pseudomonadota bacterium]